MAAEGDLAPDEVAVLTHLEELFGGSTLGVPPDARFEIAWSDERDALDNGRVPLRHARTFALDELEDAAAFAAEVNEPGTNIYVGGALRTPDAPLHGRCSDEHVLGTAWLWSDLDDGEAVSRARELVKRCLPNLAIATGTIPARRAHLWWRLDEVLTDHARIRAALSGLAAELGGDASVTNPSRVMRLAGTVSWPTPKKRAEGKRPELVSTAPVKGLRPTEYALEQVEAAYPPQDAPRVDRGGNGAGGEPVWSVVGLRSVCTDGRHQIGRDIVHRHFMAFCGEHGSAPSTEELFAEAWPEWQARIDQTRPGKGEDYCRWLCGDTVQRFEKGKLKGAATLEEAIARDREWRSTADERKEEPVGAIEDVPLFPIDESTIPTRPWLVEGLILRGQVTILVASPGAGKSALSAQFAIMCAMGKAWGPFQPRGTYKTALFNVEDDHDEQRRRAAAAARVMDVDQATLSDRVWLPKLPAPPIVATQDRLQGIQETKWADELIAYIRKRDLDVVVIDPLAEFHSVEENDNIAMKAVLGVFRRVARETGCAIILIHHVPKYSEGRAGDLNVVRGGGAIAGSVRVAYTLMTMTAEEAEGLNILPEDRRHYSRLDDAKSSYAAPAGRALWWHRQTVELSNGNGLEPSDTAPAYVPFEQPGPFDGLRKEHVEAIADILETGIQDEQGRPTGRLYGEKRGKADIENTAVGVIMSVCGVPLETAKARLKAWIASGFIVETEQEINRKPRRGYTVDRSNMPMEFV